MAMFFPPMCSSPSLSKERESREHVIDPTKYDNWRPGSVLSFSTYSRGAGRETAGGDHSTASISALQTIEEPIVSKRSMINFGHARHGSVISIASSIANEAAPGSLLGKIKYYYDAWGCRKYVPVVLLLLYSIAGAAMFYMIEHDNEITLKKETEAELDVLRNATLHKLHPTFFKSKRSNELAMQLLRVYEEEFDKKRLPPGLDWDYWGALYYVGALYTTIGYGNIVPRTIVGKAMSIVYAIVGIPLVLAILSQCGRAMTEWLSEWWQRRRFLKRKKSHIQNIRFKSMEEGKKEDELDEIESRTIPVWLALGLCIGWISACAALFMIWEKKWTYFTSLYFFCISLSTIGLGDVVPDHPRMLILMFWLVIIGLCIVSMLLSVIQIKMEEWLYNFMIRMQKKYKEAMADGKVDSGEILNRVMDEQPWYLRNFAPALLTEKQQHQIEQQAETFERVAREWNNKNIQTDFGPTSDTISKGIEAVETAISIACDPISFREPKGNVHTQYSEQMFTASIAPPNVILPNVTASDEDSISDAPSLPLDSESANNFSEGRRRSSGIDGFESVASTLNDEFVFMNNNGKVPLLEREVQTSKREEVVKFSRSCGADKSMSESISVRTPKPTMAEEQGAQTDIAQFQINEILLKLHGLQQHCHPASANGKNVMERSVETTASILEMMMDEDAEKDDKSTQYDVAPTIALMEKAVLTDVLNVLHRSMEANPELCNQGIQCIGERRDSGTDSMLPDVRSFGTMLDSGEYKKEVLDLVDSGTDFSLRESLIEKCDAVTQSASVELRDASSSPHHAASQCRSAGTTPPPERHPIATQTNEEEMDKTSLPPISPVFSPPPARKPTIVCEATVSIDPISSHERSTQMTPPADRKTLRRSPHSTSPLGRSDSLQSLAGSIQEEKQEMQDIVVQTDDSYLKIARRLDQYRSNRTQFLPVCAADPLSPNSAAAASDRQGASNRGFFIDPFKDRRKSLKFSMRKKNQATNHASAQTSTSLDPEGMKAALEEADDHARSISPYDEYLLMEARKSGALKRKASLPVGIPRGRVADFVRSHERGIPNPGVVGERKVIIVRQHSMGVGQE